jgi:hypothetical protein
MTGLQSFSPEIWSLICQDPILERLDLNSICLISHAFRNEALRELSIRFPCVRGVRRVKAWCLSLQSRPHIAINVEGLLLPQPQPPAFREDHIELLKQALHMCVNLKELVVLFQEPHLRRPGMQEPKYSWSTHMLNDHPFKLTKFVNGYFSQDDTDFKAFLSSQTCLESLELHSGKKFFCYDRLVNSMESLACPSHFLYCCLPKPTTTRLRLDFENSLGWPEIDRLGSLVKHNRQITSLAIFSKKKQPHFLEIMSVIARSHINIRHIEIHQFHPTQVSPYLPRN